MTFPVTFWIFLPQIINLSTFIIEVTRLVFCRHYFKIFILYNLAFFNNWLNYICIWGILGILLSSRHYITAPKVPIHFTQPHINDPLWPNTPRNGQGWSEIAGDGQKWQGMARNGQEWLGIARDGRKLAGIGGDCQGWPEMNGDCRNCLGMGGNGRGFLGMAGDGQECPEMAWDGRG